MGRRILLVTTDQQRYDSLGCNGGRIARTPVADRLAAEGIRYTRAVGQNVTCMPARATIVTGQYARRHGVVTNGIPLPDDGRNVASLLQAAGYRTALIGKAHFEPASHSDYFENWAAARDLTGPHRGFDRMELAGHTGRAGRSLFHYPKWLKERHPDEVELYYPTIGAGGRPNGAGGGETGAPQVHVNPIPRGHYHTDWVADRTIAFLDGLDADEDWFVWMSFPDPHHPWDPPASETGRVDWRDLPLPAGYPGSPERCREVLAGKPRHWLEWFEGWRQFNFEVPVDFVPARLTPDQIREVDAMTHVENELVDEALGRVLARIAARGWAGDTDVLYTTDHGEFQGDFGLLFKGPFHVDALMHLPMIWRPAPSAGVAPAVVPSPVGQVDLAPTICRIAGLEAPAWMQGRPLPVDPARPSHERMLTEWDGGLPGAEMKLRSITRDGWCLTAYEKGPYYAGTEGELYDLADDPHQWVNRWDDPACLAVKRDLLADLYDNLPAARETPLEAVAPV